ncbi:MAG: hypothetical protein QM607_11500 [Microbacterium sp.]
MGEPLNWSAAAQGDIIAFDHLSYWTGDDEDPEQVETPHGVVLLSQTCDLVQDRDRVLVAPVAEVTTAVMSAVRKGAKPLLIPVGAEPNHVADLERALSVPRAVLDGAAVLTHSVQERSGEAADRLSARIGRGLHRFAFPDAVHDSLSKMKKKIAEWYEKSTSLATVLRLVDEFRISCPDWESAGRDISITAVVPEEYLPAADARDSSWRWGVGTVTDLKNGEIPASLTLERVSQLILKNIEAENDAAVVALWETWMDTLAKAVLPAATVEVASIELGVMSDVEYTYRLLKSSETLDFSVLSDSSREGTAAAT